MNLTWAQKEHRLQGQKKNREGTWPWFDAPQHHLRIPQSTARSDQSRATSLTTRKQMSLSGITPCPPFFRIFQNPQTKMTLGSFCSPTRLIKIQMSTYPTFTGNSVGKRILPPIHGKQSYFFNSLDENLTTASKCTSDPTIPHRGFCCRISERKNEMLYKCTFPWRQSLEQMDSLATILSRVLVPSPMLPPPFLGASSTTGQRRSNKEEKFHKDWGDGASGRPQRFFKVFSL